MQSPFNLFGKAFSGGSILGVDIGTTSIKMAEVRGGKEKPFIENYGFLDFERLSRAFEPGVPDEQPENF